MSLFPVLQRILNKAGTAFIEPRREDGHGSSALNPSFVNTGLTTQTDALTRAELDAAPVVVDTGLNQPTTPGDVQPISDATDIEYTSVATTVTAIGDTTVYTPAAGKRVRLHWVYAINDPVATSSTKITISMGGTTYYVAWALSKRQRLTGPVNGALVVNLSAAGNVAFTAFLEEV